MEKELTVGGIISEGFQLALKNAASILGAVVLWALTIWIPYINVGTTIAIMTMPIELSKGNIMSPLSIFDPKYRKYMGEVFILLGLIYIAVSIAAAFLFVPAIVISLAWSLSVYLLLDKGMNPTEAINKSNELTYGKKWTMFFGKMVLALAPYIVLLVGAAIGGGVGYFIMFIGAIFMVPFVIAGDAIIYKTLVVDKQQ